MKVREFLKTKKGIIKWEKVRITKIASEKDKILEGKTGTLTAPFVAFKGVLGVYLDNPVNTKDKICNLTDEDEIDVIMTMVSNYILCQNCNKKLYKSDKVIKKWIGWDDGDYGYFCSVECAEEYCKDMPKTDNEIIQLSEADIQKEAI